VKNNSVKLKKGWVEKEEKLQTNFLLILSLISLIAFYLTVDPRYLLGFYGEVELSPQANYAQFAFQVSIFATVIQNTRNYFNHPKKSSISFKYYILNIQGVFVSSLIAIYLLSVLLSGDR